MGQCSILLEGGVPISQFICMGAKLKLPTEGGGAQGIYFSGEGNKSSMFYWRAEGSSLFQGGG